MKEGRAIFLAMTCILLQSLIRSVCTNKNQCEIANRQRRNVCDNIVMAAINNFVFVSLRHQRGWKTRSNNYEIQTIIPQQIQHFSFYIVVFGVDTHL